MRAHEPDYARNAPVRLMRCGGRSGPPPVAAQVPGPGHTTHDRGVPVPLPWLAGGAAAVYGTMADNMG